MQDRGDYEAVRDAARHRRSAEGPVRVHTPAVRGAWRRGGAAHHGPDDRRLAPTPRVGAPARPPGAGSATHHVGLAPWLQDTVRTLARAWLLTA